MDARDLLEEWAAVPLDDEWYDLWKRTMAFLKGDDAPVSQEDVQEEGPLRRPEEPER